VSYQRSRSAIENGAFLSEIVPFTIKSAKGDKTLDVDEEPFSVDLEKLVKLRPAFAKEGTITAGNASSINDGAALLLVCDPQTAKQNGWQPLAKIVAQASHAQDPKWFTTAPVQCVKNVLERAKLAIDDIDLWEINEAFAVVPMAATKDLNLDPTKVNVNGGAVSLGHPIGCSGARILVTLIHALKARSKKRGLATLCIGGGEASAVIVEIV
jgi:acetyl-CoA C-acetyltransferase